jgi:lysozyme family protein
MAEFKEAFDITMAHEGGYSDHPNDYGNVTYAGISRRYHPTWNGWLIIDKYKRLPNFPSNLTGNEAIKEQVYSFYKKNFWDANKLDQVKNQSIANEVFDTGVNMGYRVAAEFLQRAYNLLSKDEQAYKKLYVDGQIGSKTISAINAHPQPIKLLKALNILQGAKYITICERDSSQEVFFSGWIERVSV